jgi:hypothetical protein
MSFLTTYWKQIAIGLFIALVFSFGYYKGYSNQKEKFDIFKLQIEANAKAQKQKNDLLIKQHEKVTEDVARDYEKAIKQLRSYYNNRMLNNPSSSRMSKNASTTSTTDGKTESNLSSSTGNITLDCASDVLQLLFLQEWIKNQLLIENVLN